MTKDKQVWVQCIVQLDPQFDSYSQGSNRQKKVVNENRLFILAGFNCAHGIRRFVCDLNKKKLTVIEEEGFLEEKSFMDLKQISYNKVVAVTYDAHYYIIQYEG